MKKTNQFSDYTIKQLKFNVAESFIITHHYSHSFPATCIRLGAYDNNSELIGVIVYGMSCQPAMAQSIVPILNHNDYYELQRLFVKDCTEQNFESWFIAQSISWLIDNRPKIKMLVSFADPYEGHVGTVYQATNWIFTGKSNNTTEYFDKNGKKVHARTIAKGNIDRSTLTKERRPGKYRYVMFLTKTIDVYYNIITNEYIRMENLHEWLHKEQEDNVLYLRRKNGYLMKHKIDLIKSMKHPILPYPKINFLEP